MCACGCGHNFNDGQTELNAWRADRPIHLCGVFEPGKTETFRESCVALIVREKMNAA